MAERNQLVVTFPRDGDVLNRHDGEERDGVLATTVRGKAWPGATITVLGQQAKADEDGAFEVPVRLTPGEQELEVLAAGATASAWAKVRVIFMPHSRPRYRFSVDDNILFLRDLARAPDEYPSLFDHWYLGFWRQVHKEYGTKIHINIYFADGEGFTLEEMPDRWRDEWSASGDWLHLTFHARANLPNRIYKDATYEEMAEDLARVHQQILRFAGEEVMSRWTTVHWAECPREAAQAVYDAGYRGLIILARVPGDQCTTRYYLTPELAEHIAGRDLWKDFDMDLLFLQCDQVVNSVALEDVVPLLEEVVANPHTGELVELLIHEQYFRRDLPLYYQPDATEKVRRAVAFVAERGYQPVFWQDELL